MLFASDEIDAVAWAMVNSQLAYPIADRLDIAKVAVCDTVNPSSDDGLGQLIFQAFQPSAELG